MSCKVIPPFHLWCVKLLVISKIGMVELWVELGWNYMKFHPNSTYNSTYFILLIFNMLSMRWWNGGITFSKIFFCKLWLEICEEMWKYTHFIAKSSIFRVISVFIYSIRLSLTKEKLLQVVVGEGCYSIVKA